MSESKAKMWFPLYIGDYLADTQHLTNGEHGAYLLILMHQWRTGAMKIDQMRNVSKMPADAWSISQATLMEFFTVDGAGRYYQARMERDRLIWTEKQRKSKEKASKAAKTRWENTRRKKEATEGGSGTMLQALPKHGPSMGQASGKNEGKNASEGIEGERETNERGNEMLQAFPEHSSSSAKDHAKTMPFTFTSRSTSPSQAQGKRPSGADSASVSRSRKKPVDASGGAETTQSPSVASAEPLHGESGLHSAHPMVRSAEQRTPTKGDSRFHPFKGVLHAWWAQINGKPATECPWGGRDDKALKEMLVAEGHLTLDGLRDRLARRWVAVDATSMWPSRKKGKVSATAPMWDVLSKLVRYSEHPVDDFGEML